MRPCRLTQELFLYLLAWAAGTWGVGVIGAYVGSTHYHLVVHDPLGRLTDFVRDLNGLFARVMNYRLGRVGATFWESKRVNPCLLVDRDKVLNRTAYAAANPTQDGLLSNPSKWRGVWLTPRDLGRTLTFLRPKTKFFGKRTKMPESVELKLVKPEGFAHLTDAQYKAAFESELGDMVEAAHEEVRAKGWSFLGARAIASVKHGARARRREKHGRANVIHPLVAATTLKDRIDAIVAIAEFRIAYAAALSAWRLGDRTVVFPHGTNQMRRVHNVRVGRPPP